MLLIKQLHNVGQVFSDKDMESTEHQPIVLMARDVQNPETKKPKLIQHTSKDPELPAFSTATDDVTSPQAKGGNGPPHSSAIPA